MAIYPSPQNGATHEDVVKLTALRLDLDVDSNNEGTVEPDNVEEDKIETTSPGKLIKLDNGDLDGDNIVDNVDYNINGNGFSTPIFAEMKLRIPQSIDLNNCKISLSYDASTPPAAEGGTLATTGSIRVWKKQSNVARNPAPIGGENQSGTTGGDYVMPTNWTVQSGQEAYYTPTQLLASGNREVTLFIEGIAAASNTITVSITPVIPRTAIGVDLPTDENTVPENYNLSDSVLVSVFNFDLDIDSDNTNGFAAPDRSWEEDKIEDDSTKPGKIICLNNLDTDYDGVPDFADGYDITLNNVNQAGDAKSAVFVPLVVEIPSWVDLNIAKIKFTYSTSDPSGVTVSGDGTAASPYIYTPAAGNLRIWTKNGNVSRLKTSIAASGNPGDYIPTATMISASALFSSSRTITLYIEALSNSATVGDLTIKAELYPNFDNNPTGIMDDQVRCTVVKVETVHPIDGDFTSKAGRVMINNRNGDNNYYTTANTTVADGKAQTVNCKVKISAYVVPALENIDVYFEAIDPDDLSPYEGKSIVNNTTTGNEDTNPNDNRDANAKMDGTFASYNAFQGTLSARTAKTVLVNNNAIAEVELTVTDICSGDNYIVRAVCRNPGNAPFDTNSAATTNIPINTQSGIAQSALLVAWKRAYIEESNMYKNGATITVAAVAAGTTLTVDNVADFTVNDAVTVFLPPNGTTTLARTVTAIDAVNNIITLNAAHGIAVPQYSGVQISANNDVYTNNLDYLTMAYGNNTNGHDGANNGGTFVEYTSMLTKNVPKYTAFPDDNTMFAFGWAWFTNTNQGNVFQLVAAKYHIDGSFGTARSADRQVFITIDAFGIIDVNKKQPETTGHEIGHLWNVQFPHIDHSSGRHNHANDDMCVMSYDRNRADGIARFCLECLFHVRDKNGF